MENDVEFACGPMWTHGLKNSAASSFVVRKMIRALQLAGRRAALRPSLRLPVSIFS